MKGLEKLSFGYCLNFWISTAHQCLCKTNLHLFILNLLALFGFLDLPLLPPQFPLLPFQFPLLPSQFHCQLGFMICSILCLSFDKEVKTGLVTTLVWLKKARSLRKVFSHIT